MCASPLIFSHSPLNLFQSGFCQPPPPLFHPITLLEIPSYLHISKSSVQSSLFLLFDLTLAVAAIHHPFLLKTLSSLGLQGTTLSWFFSSFTGQSFQVSFVDSFLSSSPLDFGGPQDSDLGSILYLYLLSGCTALMTCKYYPYMGDSPNPPAWISYLKSRILFPIVSLTSPFRCVISILHLACPNRNIHIPSPDLLYPTSFSISINGNPILPVA